MIVCTQCGAQNMDGLNYCDQCGAKLPAPVPAGAPSAQVMTAGAGMPVSPPVAAAPPTAGVKCACGHVNPLGSNFCEECGMPLSAPVPPPSPPSGLPVTLPKFLLATGATINFTPNAAGIWQIGREDAQSGIHPDVDMTTYDTEQTVSRRHAQISLMNGQYMLTSLTTTNWTKLGAVKLTPNQPVPIKPGDQIEFAKCVVTFGVS
jgi:hypothetical protein